MRVRFTNRGDWRKTIYFLKSVSSKDFRSILEGYGQRGVQSLERATPVDTGETSKSWSYKLEQTKKGYSLSWYNSNMAGSVPLVILIQYGHGTRGGSYVQGIDIINPAMRPILDAIANDIWKEVTRL